MPFEENAGLPNNRGVKVRIGVICTFLIVTTIGSVGFFKYKSDEASNATYNSAHFHLRGTEHLAAKYLTATDAEHQYLQTDGKFVVFPIDRIMQVRKSAKTTRPMTLQVERRFHNALSQILTMSRDRAYYYSTEPHSFRVAINVDSVQAATWRVKACANRMSSSMLVMDSKTGAECLGL